MSTMTKAAMDVLAERQRQIEDKGWTPEHDDQHDRGTLSAAAACYACTGSLICYLDQQAELPEDERDLDLEEIGEPARWKAPINDDNLFDPNWPWDESAWKPSNDARRNLVKAAALLIAEIERLDRASIQKPQV